MKKIIHLWNGLAYTKGSSDDINKTTYETSSLRIILKSVANFSCCMFLYKLDRFTTEDFFPCS